MLTANAARPADVLVRELQRPVHDPAGRASRVWGVAEALARAAVRPAASATTCKSFATSLTAPYCGVNSGFEAVGWLDDPAAARRSR